MLLELASEHHKLPVFPAPGCWCPVLSATPIAKDVSHSSCSALSFHWDLHTWNTEIRSTTFSLPHWLTTVTSHLVNFWWEQRMTVLCSPGPVLVLVTCCVLGRKNLVVFLTSSKCFLVWFWDKIFYLFLSHRRTGYYQCNILGPNSVLWVR